MTAKWEESIVTQVRDLRVWLVSFFTAMALVASLLGVKAEAVELGASKKASREKCAFTGNSAARKVARRPAVAVRVSNSPDARPQSGVESADFVIETLTEGNTTRLIAFFHCSPASTAGPVRSARMDDAAIVAPYSKLFAFSGANAPVMDALESSALTLVTEAGSENGLQRTPADSTDVNSIHADVAGLRSLASAAGAGKPSTGFRFGKVQGPRTSVTTIELDFGGTTVGYRWTKSGWARTQDGATFTDASGRQVKTNNVLVQEVDAKASKSLFDSTGVASPRFDLEGSGRAWLFRDGRMVKGTWSDSGAGAPVFKTSKGAVMNLARGRTWLEMVPSADSELAGAVSFR
jgi:hypothetical protein